MDIKILSYRFLWILEKISEQGIFTSKLVSRIPMIFKMIISEAKFYARLSISIIVNLRFAGEMGVLMSSFRVSETLISQWF